VEAKRRLDLLERLGPTSEALAADFVWNGRPRTLRRL
jgi:hypothetical protein